MAILRYSEFISEPKGRTKNTPEGMSIMENEYLRMKSEGLTESHINENIFTSVLGSLGGGFTDTFKDYVIDWAAEKIGIEPFDERGEPTFFYQVIRNIIEEVSFTDLGKYFGKGSCGNWATAIIKGLIESLEEKTISYLLPKLGLNIDMSTGMGGTIAASIREALTNSLNDVAFMKKVEGMISDKICGFNLGDVLSGSNSLTSPDKVKLSSEVEKAETKDPNIFSKIMKSGLSELLPTS